MQNSPKYKNASIYTSVPDSMLNEVLLMTPYKILWDVFMDNIEQSLFLNHLGDKAFNYISLAISSRNDADKRLKDIGIPYLFNHIDYNVITKRLINFHLYKNKPTKEKNTKFIIKLPPYEYWINFLHEILKKAYNNFNGIFNFLWLIEEENNQLINLKTILGYADIDTRLRFLEAYNTSNNYEEFSSNYFYRSLIEGLLHRIKEYIISEDAEHGYDALGWPIWSEYNSGMLNNDEDGMTFPEGLLFHPNKTILEKIR